MSLIDQMLILHTVDPLVVQRLPLFFCTPNLTELLFCASNQLLFVYVGHLVVELSHVHRK